MPTPAGPRRSSKQYSVNAEPNELAARGSLLFVLGSRLGGATLGFDLRKNFTNVLGGSFHSRLAHQ